MPERFADPSGRFCIVEPLTENNCSVTVERGVAGEELKAINAYYMRTLAEMMANMHLVSLQNNCQIRLNTIWNLYDLQADLLQGYRLFSRLFAKYFHTARLDWKRWHCIDATYRSKWARLWPLWQNLPRCAVQGDFSTNNVLIDKNGKIASLIDFNIAGSDVLVNDLITQAMFISEIMDLAEGLQDADRFNLFRIFIEEYLRHRPLTEPELAAMNSIYNLASSFFWPVIEDLEQLLAGGDYQKANEVLEDILQSLTCQIF